MGSYEENEGGQYLDVAERNRVWLESKQKKLESMKALRVDPEAEQYRECTFKPMINRTSLKVAEKLRNQTINDSVFSGSQ